MEKILIVPGLFGSGEGHWQRNWLDDVAGSRLVEQSDWNRPCFDEWVDRLEAELSEGPAFIVAHSLGCHVTAALARRSSAGQVRGAMLVAPCDLSITRKLHAENFAAVHAPETRTLPFPSVVVGSLNDIYMPFENLTEITAEWGADVHILGQAGHINIESGYGRWTGGYGIFRQLQAKVQHQDKIPARREIAARSYDALRDYTAFRIAQSNGDCTEKRSTP
ncbi:RBBP9/YdeN family alpha/beta hydrolase [Rhizobium sp. C4]|uniref:RBBP9/YdeN family alpha/beta hydrolase n=1 Tax=Rhizobium sp. C4 TaxID=1349800 RepID=UPI001E50BDEE|nr:alpha/beta hydrolase [Rhizobium sp. C4]MCD2172384.1 alpha/beta hydrolase [Rhizobium sp. C4]